MHILSYAPFGADGIILRIEADIRRGIPGVEVIGLPDGAVREARERVRVAFRNSGFPFPSDRVLVNLAPAGLRKEGASLDLPIALAVMVAAGLIGPVDGLMVLGELELSGQVRPVRGVVAATAAGLREGVAGFIVPEGNASEAAILAGDRSAAVRTLDEAVRAIDERSRTGRFPVPSSRSGDRTAQPPLVGDFSEARGQGRYKRALEIAAAGGHNLLVFGPPGGGKTMLARRLPSILAPLSADEAVEATSIHSLAGALDLGSGLIRDPPFRAPHHSASTEGLLGGGRQVRPGEISLAHFGVLFLDEAPEFRAPVLRALREPLEDARITISRAERSLCLPADFQLLLAANPCPCGRLGRFSNGTSSCLCSLEEIARHWRRLGSALLDRVELRVPLLPPSTAALLPGEARPESSREIAARVARAVGIQRERYAGLGVRRNARLGPFLIERFCALEGEALRAFSVASEKLVLSARATHAVLRVARTIADLSGETRIAADHVLEAVQHRRSGDDPWEIVSLQSRGMPSM